MDASTFLKGLGHGEIPRVLLFHGSEPFLLNDALRRFTTLLLPDPSGVTLNRELLEAKEVTSETIVHSCETAPFLSEWRLVVVRGAQSLSAKAREPIEAYVRSPNPTTCLVFVSDEPLPTTHWLLKLLPASGVVEARGLLGAGLVSWLRHYVRANGFEAPEDALTLLVEHVGEELTTLVSELEKVFLSLPPGTNRLTPAAIHAVVGEQRTRSIFELTRAMERRDLPQGLTVLDRLLVAGEEPLGVLGMLTRELRLLWQTKEWLRQGRAVEEIAKLTRRPVRVVEGVLGRAEATSAQTLSRGLERCWEVEQSLKSGGHPRAEMTLLFVDLCQ
jgi:DNA polymerase-3 subunit delta